MECVVPKLLFPYGTENSRLAYFIKDSLQFIGVWIIEKKSCEDTIQNNYKVKSFQLFKITRTRDKETIIIGNSITGEFYSKYHRVVCKVTERLDQGDYNLCLTMTYKGREYIHTAYFSIHSSKIIARISNGQFHTIPYQRVNVHGDKVFYNFTLNGSESEAPDDMVGNSSARSRMTFKWYCRLIGCNESLLNQDTNESHIHYNATICRDRTWLFDHVVSTEVSPVFSTKVFAENMTYEFQLIVETANRSSRTSQIIHIQAGFPPKLDLK